MAFHYGGTLQKFTNSSSGSIERHITQVRVGLPVTQIQQLPADASRGRFPRVLPLTQIALTAHTYDVVPPFCPFPRTLPAGASPACFPGLRLTQIALT